ncbi:hypothetical protein KC343_g5621 [Hortaea werneckii]|uniref:PHD-type domain-containing protein n=1 Tax=Hortaea werneckii TaxID=91943 RepID=A0A3M7G9D3_HORWE|nr:hypothetical protein KC352_g12604 [Hortaea werneckii]KAI7569611.1 hypothetical protein KC317_g3185 [Hortaea werneckii]KAI7623532.1 hypothetical protein KC346_g2691 [Hortaea werneckii]KAI7628772.1 hypothetical protein KC343_g5621 [Hortaea werneckii]KAI7680117.1 hypothetical protein KC319_g2363 [Hortaea werneckii]
MSFSLSSLLNPAPAGDNPDQQQENQHQQPNNAAGPTYQYGYSAPDDRRPSIELPPPETGRPVSSHSPTLEQYQVASRSPEQRRASLVPGAATASSGVTLPPLQNVQEPRNSGPGATGEGPHVKEGEGEREPVQHMNVQDPTSAADQPSADAASSAPAKREPDPTSTTSTPMDARRSVQPEEGHTLKPVASLKSEHSFPRMQSPLRESSVPVPSTEPATDEKPATAPSKKRPAPTKKGTATVSKKKKTTASTAAPANKKRKVDRASETPSARKPSTLKATATGSSPAPSSIRSRSPAADGEEEEEDEEFDEDEDVEGSGEFYCICRKPDNGTFMIGCDGTCDDWYHGKCVGVEERDKNLIDAYYCPACTSKGEGLTTWKRICRRKGCRMPARIAGRGAKGGEKSGGSKYCSEECGVLYFREMVARTRGKEEQGRNRTSRRKGSVLSAQQQAFQEEEEDVGAKGGILAAGEIKALITSAKNVEDFRKLGEGVLSPPATPDRKEDKTDNTKDEANAAPAFTDAEATALETIHRQKDEARRRHGLLKDRMKFVTLVKQAAARTASERELKPKEYCGYDPRLEWTEAQFAQWRASPAGKQALELETLDIADNSTGGEHPTQPAAENGDVSMSNTLSSNPDSTTADHYTDTTALLLPASATPTICDRKKCARHLEWGKLVVDDLRFEMGDNSDRMRGLAKAEREVRERAALRAKGAGGIGEGVVLVHEMPGPSPEEGGEGAGEGEGMEGVVVESGVREGGDGPVPVSNGEGGGVEVVQSVEHAKTGGVETSAALLAVDHPDLAAAVTATTAPAQMDGRGDGDAMDVDPA